MGDRFKGRRVLVTGSSRGIGLAIATALAGAGADVVLNARDSVALGEAAATLADGGARVRGVAFDVTNSESVNDAIEHIESGTRIKARVPLALAGGLAEFATF